MITRNKDATLGFSVLIYFNISFLMSMPYLYAQETLNVCFCIQLCLMQRVILIPSITRVNTAKRNCFSDKSSWISANLGSLVINLMSNCSWENSQKPYVNYNKINLFIFMWLAPINCVQSFFFFCGVYNDH